MHRGKAFARHDICLCFEYFKLTLGQFQTCTQCILIISSKTPLPLLGSPSYFLLPSCPFPFRAHWIQLALPACTGCGAIHWSMGYPNSMHTPMCMNCLHQLPIVPQPQESRANSSPLRAGLLTGSHASLVLVCTAVLSSWKPGHAMSKRKHFTTFLSILWLLHYFYPLFLDVPWVGGSTEGLV